MPLAVPTQAPVSHAPVMHSMGLTQMLQVCEAHTEWGCSFQEAHPPLPPQEGKQQPQSPTRLRLGYLSADLYTHSVSYFAEAPLRHHDPDRHAAAAAAALPVC